MCIARTTTAVAQRSLCSKMPVKQLVVPLRSKCTTFIEEPIYRPRFRKQEWEQQSLLKKLFGRMNDAWQMSYFGKRVAVGLALAWYMFQDLENPHIFIDSLADTFEEYEEDEEEGKVAQVKACLF